MIDLEFAEALSNAYFFVNKMQFFYLRHRNVYKYFAGVIFGLRKMESEKYSH
jgi:hypothetical protein